MSSFFSRKKGGAAPPPLTATSATFPSITASPPPSSSPVSIAPSSPLSTASLAEEQPPLTSLTLNLNVNVKKVKKKSLLSKIFHKSTKPPSQPNSPSSPSTKPEKKGGSMLSIFRRKTKKKTVIKNERGEDEEREISVSVTVSRIPRALEDDDDGLGSGESDDVLIYPIFGVPLTKIFEVKASMLGAAAVTLALPKQIIDVCEFIRFTGLKNEGLFRISGESASIKEMKEKLDRGEELELTREQLNPHDLTGLFKLYWRSLPEPLFPFSAYDGLLHAVDEKDWNLVTQLVHEFPEPNRSIVEYLVSFLGEVAVHGESNRMTPMNLAVCFAPNLMRMKEEKVERVMADAPKIIGVIQRLIEVKRQHILDERAREDAEEKAKLEAEAQMAEHTRNARAQAEAQQRALKASEAQAAIEKEIEDQMRLDAERKEQEAREAAARAKAKAYAQAQMEKRKAEGSDQSDSTSDQQKESPPTSPIVIQTASVVSIAIPTIEAASSQPDSRDESSAAPFSFQLTITGDDGNQTTLNQSSQDSLPVVEDDEEEGGDEVTFHNPAPVTHHDTAESHSSTHSELPEWAHHSEEHKRLEEIAKLEASLRDRAAEAQRARALQDQTRIEQLQREKEAAKQKSAAAKQSMTSQSSTQAVEATRTELEIVASRVTNKNGDSEQDYWQQIY